MKRSIFYVSHFTMVRTFVLTVFFLIFFTWSKTRAQTSNEEANLRQPTCISTYYFGPNAFPVPDMLDGTVRKKLYVEFGGDYYKGWRGDVTRDVSLKVVLPLFSNKVNLSCWVPFEFWRNSERNIKVCRLEHVTDRRLMKGNTIGDIYLSTDLQVLSQQRHYVDCTARVALKTASSYFYFLGRYYDSPGYFGDVSVGRTFKTSPGGFVCGVRLAVSTGFLCWQTDNGRQDDAYMYGAQLQLLLAGGLKLACTFGGYSGWEHSLANGTDAHDSPMTIKTDCEWNYKNWKVAARVQHGLRDYPYNQLRLAVGYNISVFKKGNKR